ncbi:MAG TPA: HAMP domain-containing sensor histidine kinase [Candidatus Saccharimonadales bacterium]|nr:HAMP domain-containing sensor histidine kinase [Candidatus Saccharimonadales bacterium]
MISPGLISLHTYLYIFAIAAVIMATLGIFIKNLYSRLSTRIAVLILASGPIALIITRVLNELFFRTRLPFHFHILQIIHWLEVLLVVLGAPVLLGLLAAGFIRRPLRQFNKAMVSLKQSNYKVQLQPTGIYEFDEVFTKFNNLINRLQHEEKLRKDLVSDTSHELKTPLTAMIGQLTAMQEGKHAATKERIATLKEQAERLAELVQQLDAHTKARIPDSGEPEDIPLKQFCQQLTGHFGAELKQKSILTKFNIPGDLIIRANRSALQRILTNLIQNALRYSEATELVITASSHQLTFSDNGKGVPATSLPYLFERFYRVDKSRNRAAGGLGLGLAIVKELAEQQGWDVHAEHARPGITFVFTFR